MSTCTNEPWQLLLDTNEWGKDLELGFIFYLNFVVCCGCNSYDVLLYVVFSGITTLFLNLCFMIHVVHTNLILIVIAISVD